MTETKLRTIAKDLIYDHAKDVEMLTLAEEYDLDEQDALHVLELIRTAKVSVTWL